MSPILQLRKVSVAFKTEDGLLNAISQINIEVGQKEMVCLVGESGSGKTIASLSVMRLIDYENGVITDGEILFRGRNLAVHTQQEMGTLRGKKIAMVFQDPMNALDPVFTIGSQIIDVIRTHTRVSRSEAWEQAVTLLEKVGIPEPELRMRQYPYELSGGMLQRAMIAIALACGPELLIADEPTTALDVTIQDQILKLLRELKERMDMSILLITHDLGVAAEMADRIIVMYAGKIVEEGSARHILTEPRHPYTQGLLKSIGSYGSGGKRLYTILGSIPPLAALPTGCRFHPRCPAATARCRTEEPVLSGDNGRQVACWHPGSSLEITDGEGEPASGAAISRYALTNNKQVESDAPLLIEVEHLSKAYPIQRTFFQRHKQAVKAVDNISFGIRERETFGLVGESGCGKSTLGKLLLQLEKPTGGSIHFQKRDLLTMSDKEFRQTRKELQVVFQDPAGSVNPRWRVEDIIGEPLQVHQGLKGSAKRDKVKEIMELVGLNPQWYSRFPHEFSGGQRQRIGIARAIVLKPKFILLDEAVSALDISVQSQIINLLQELQERFGLTYLFIAHGLDAVRHISNRIGVMYLGKMVEIAPAERLFLQPAHPYTKALLDAKPSADPNKRREVRPLQGEIPSPVNPPSGCRFHPRCPAATDKCKSEEPPLLEIGSDHSAACLYPLIGKS